jgi:hypothetical protein
MLMANASLILDGSFDMSLSPCAPVKPAAVTRATLARHAFQVNHAHPLFFSLSCIGLSASKHWGIRALGPA